MRRQYAKAKVWAGLFLAAVVWIGYAAALHGQTAQSLGERLSHVFGSGEPSSAPTSGPCPAQAYNQDAPEPGVSTTNMSADVRNGYRLFRAKCGECHSLNQQASKAESSAQDWTNMVNRMRDMPSSHMTDAQSAIIAKFVIWEADFSNDMVKTLMAFDSNGDGKLERSEVPERMQGLFDRGDTNKDGVLTPEEIRKLADAQGSSVVAMSAICDPEQRLKDKR